MINIDYIMDLIDWNNSVEMQKEGIVLARNVRCINVFLQPGHTGHGKNVWDNCAKILSERSDDELKPYLYNLFKWLTDMNWPGAEDIYNRLKNYNRDEIYDFVLNECINEALALNEPIWLKVLQEFNNAD